MRTVSTGVGLCVLGGCVLAAALVSSPRFSNPASAAGIAQRTVPPPMAIRPEGSPMQRTPMPSNSSLTDCEVRVEHWFSPTPHVIQGCADMPWTNLQAASMPADILGNGTQRLLGSGTWYLISPPYEESSAFLELLEFHIQTDGTTSMARLVVLSGADTELLNNLASLGAFEEGGAYFGGGMGFVSGGLADVDLDGDLDLVVTWGGNGNFSSAWLENIKGDAVRANPYDHDGDGHVTTADLSLLLMNFD